LLNTHLSSFGAGTIGQLLATYQRSKNGTVSLASCKVLLGAAKGAVSNWLNREHIKHWESIIGLRQAKELISGPVKVEQGPIKMDNGSTHRSLPSKRTPFQDGTDE
jgi:hypothetical protein